MGETCHLSAGAAYGKHCSEVEREGAALIEESREHPEPPHGLPKRTYHWDDSKPDVLGLGPNPNPNPNPGGSEPDGTQRAQLGSERATEQAREGAD